MNSTVFGKFTLLYAFGGQFVFQETHDGACVFTGYSEGHENHSLSFNAKALFLSHRLDSHTEIEKLRLIENTARISDPISHNHDCLLFRHHFTFFLILLSSHMLYNLDFNLAYSATGWPVFELLSYSA